MNDTILFVVSLCVGFIAGILSGLLGIGGGVIFMPFLYYFLPLAGVPPHMISISAVATSLFAGCFSAGSAALNHYFSKNINFKLVLLLGAGSLVSTLIIPHFAVELPPKLLGYFLIILITVVFIRFTFNTKKDPAERKEISAKLFFPVGLFVGTLSALCGIGGGVILIPFLVNFTKIEMKSVIGTSSLLTALIMLSSALVYAFIGSGSDYSSDLTSFVVGIPLGIGALFGARIGVFGVNKLPEILLKRIFSVFLLFVIISLLLKL